MHLEVFHGRAEIEKQAIALRSLKPSKMSRLQRSMVADHVAAVGKDSTYGVAKFLEETLESLEVHMGRCATKAENWKVSLRASYDKGYANIL